MGPVCSWNSNVSDTVPVSSAQSVTACSFLVHMFSAVTFEPNRMCMPSRQPVTVSGCPTNSKRLHNSIYFNFEPPTFDYFTDLCEI